jgi:hypothetical protein
MQTRNTRTYSKDAMPLENDFAPTCIRKFSINRSDRLGSNLYKHNSTDELHECNRKHSTLGIHRRR